MWIVWKYGLQIGNVIKLGKWLEEGEGKNLPYNTSSPTITDYVSKPGSGASS